MSRVSVQMSADASAATVEVRSGAPADRELVDAVLRRAGVTHGLVEEALAAVRAAVEDPAGAGAWTVARAVPPEPGQDGWAEPGFSPGPVPGRTGPDGTIDYRERQRFVAVAAGDELVHIHPARPGRDGIGVDGRSLPAPAVRQSALGLGPGVALSGQEVVAARDGVVVWVPDRRIDVVDSTSHDGDVDLHSGHLRVRGSLMVRGAVRSGFRVEASGDVVVRGPVRGEARSDANLEVHGGAMGQDCRLEAKGDITCRHVSGASVRADGVVTIGDHAVNGSLLGTEVRATRGRAWIVGGQARARATLEIGQAGNEHEVPTLLVAGDTSEEEEELALVKGQARRSERWAGKRARDGAGRGGKGARNARSLGQRVMHLENRLAAARRERMRDGRIAVRGTVHPGVAVRIGDRSMLVVEVLRAVVFTADTEGTGLLVQEGRR